MKAGAARAVTVLAVAALAGVALLAGARWLWRGTGDGGNDPVAAFLASHWQRPLPAQGSPPADFTAVEASLAPADCGQCHADQYRDWRTSLHSRTLGDGLLWQARVLPSDQVLGCLDCHTPLAEQKALLARDLGWPTAPAGELPAYVPPDLHRQGLVCAACHVRAHTRYGPPPAPGKPAGDSAGLPHHGYRAEAAFEDSRFCGTCHQFPPDGKSLNGKPLENTLNEWRASDHAKQGRTCQSCHMPQRRHLWRGIHDADMVRQALTAELELLPLADGRVQVRARIRNSGAGHEFPTYLVPRITASLDAVAADGGERRTLASTVFTRDVDVWLSEERADTRLAPGETRALEATLPAGQSPGSVVELRLEVAPREHYERMFAAVMRESAAQLDAATRARLHNALDEARASRYSLLLQRQRIAGSIAN